ncbi:hypothetical protein EDC04DRAFT_2602273 [Pisolithus marmoratus]|nr:hypothetical protein EDC04DRAFT_2602273 [Pisolithus marmoratus]
MLLAERKPDSKGPRNCLGQDVIHCFRGDIGDVDWNLQFAYNEMSFFLVHLLQTFSSIMLAEDIQTRPPAEWGTGIGRDSQERVIIRHHFTFTNLLVEQFPSPQAGYTFRISLVLTAVLFVGMLNE